MNTKLFYKCSDKQFSQIQHKLRLCGFKWIKDNYHHPVGWTPVGTTKLYLIIDITEKTWDWHVHSIEINDHYPESNNINLKFKESEILSDIVFCSLKEG